MESVSEQPLYTGYLVIRPEPTGLSAARRQVNQLARNLGYSEDDATDIIIAVGEAMSNAYLYGTPNTEINCIYLGWRCIDEILTITINDEGKGIESTNQENGNRKPIKSRGYGIQLMRETMDNVHFEYEDGAMVVLKKRTPALISRS